MRCVSLGRAVAVALLAAAVAPLAVALPPAGRDCASRLSGVVPGERLSCLAELKRGGPGSAAPAAGAVAGLLDVVDGDSDPRLVAAALDVLRAAGPQAAPAAETVSRLLSYRHPLYQGRDKLLVVRLRAYALATLADIGPPPSALPALVDVLAHADEQSPVLELAAAARAAAALGPDGRFFVPYLVEAIPLRRSDEEVSLERFAAAFPTAEATTVQLEAVRALAAVASSEDREAIAVLTTLAAGRGGGYDGRLVTAAAEAIATIQSAAAKPSSTAASGDRR